MTPLSEDVSSKNIVLKDVKFAASDKDFLNILDHEIKQTEQNVKEMNDRFDQIQART